MIEIVTDRDRNLKNLKQIGTPKEENKIYIENYAYQKIKEKSYKEKRVFILMGHTERMEGKYASFVDAAIPVREIDFIGNTPRWNNSTWSEVFREIKQFYDDMIIVGWAVDIKGMSPKMTPELERVHREHFGGVHQLLFLLDSLEQEETFYIYRENKLVPKDGFYIYHQARKKEQLEIYHVSDRENKQVMERAYKWNPEQFENTSAERSVEKDNYVNLEIEEQMPRKGGRYRQLLQEQKEQKPTDNGNVGLALAVAMLAFVIGVGVYENRDQLFKSPDSVETNLLQDQEVEDGLSTETGASVDEDSTEASIPIEVVPGTEE